jgi:two-component system NtrC family sensor kinase
MTGERILVVDDSREQREFIVEYVLKPNGFETIIARDGLEGLEFARRHRPDLIIMDLQMPRMDGGQVVDAINTEQLDIPVILMTAHGSEAIAVEVFRKGVRDYVPKPFEVDDMLGAIDRSLVEVRLRRQKDELTEHLMVSNAHLNQRLRELKVLHSIGRGVVGLMSIEALMLRIVGAATLLTSSEEGGVFLFQNGKLICRVLKSWDQQRPFPVNQALDEPLALRAIDARQTLQFAAGEMTANPHDPFAATFTAGMAAPILIGDQCRGALLTKKIGQDGQGYTDETAALLTALADYLAVALELSTHATAQPQRSDLDSQNEARTIFLSYSRDDWEQFVYPLVERLNTAGLNVWTAQHLSIGGQEWFDQTNEALANADLMVVCVTPDSMKDIYVRMEYRYFLREKKPMMLLICQESRLPQELLDTQQLPYTDASILVEWLKRMAVPG